MEMEESFSSQRNPEIGDLVSSGADFGIIIKRISDCIFMVYLLNRKTIKSLYWDLKNPYSSSLHLLNKAK